MRAVPYAICLTLIFEFEGDAGRFRPVPALDPAGNWEIGWGHKLAGPSFAGGPLDAAGAEALARADLSAAALDVCNAINGAAALLTDNQYAALIDFAFNEGGDKFAGSTLAALVKKGMFAAAANQFGRWTYMHVNGQPVQAPGLIRRRAAELKLWQTNARTA